jgi:hypothetical protein
MDFHPAPAYSAIVDSEPPPYTPATVQSPTVRIVSQRPERRTVVDDLLRRLGNVLQNRGAWRELGNGEKAFFWALRCEPGTADILYEHTTEIRDRILRESGQDFRIEKFCFMFRGQRLVDLWCRPIQTDVPSIGKLG